MVLGKRQVRGDLLIWILVGQWPTVLAVSVGWGCLDIFPLVYNFSEILSPRAAKPKTTNPIKDQSGAVLLFSPTQILVAVILFEIQQSVA